jgi:acyl-CoA reductase-like NAD-dependent aldehyde dehydrogenase
LITGNTVVFKPSDKTPATGQWMAEAYEAAQFPPGVFNVVQGKVETGKRLVLHDSVDGVLFTGSYEVGLKIKQNYTSRRCRRSYWLGVPCRNRTRARAGGFRLVPRPRQFR